MLPASFSLIAKILQEGHNGVTFGAMQVFSKPTEEYYYNVIGRNKSGSKKHINGCSVCQQSKAQVLPCWPITAPSHSGASLL